VICLRQQGCLTAVFRLPAPFAKALTVDTLRALVMAPTQRYRFAVVFPSSTTCKTMVDSYSALAIRRWAYNAPQFDNGIPPRALRC
jgi:hypothetical protein